MTKVKGRKLLPEKELKEAIKFVKKYADGKVDKWADFFVRNKKVKCAIIAKKVGYENRFSKRRKNIDGFKVELLFSDNMKKIVDFAGFLETRSHPQFNKYKKQANFKRFNIENGNVVWRKDGDMIFPIDDLYTGKIKN